MTDLRPELPGREPTSLLRSLRDQTTSDLGGRLSVLTRQKRDHVELGRLLSELRSAPADEQDGVLHAIYRLVFPHAFAEEGVLWPVMRRLLPDGEDLTLTVEAEHQEVNELVLDLEALAVQSPERRAVLQRLVEVLDEDVRDEEDVLLPRLQTALSGRRLRVLGLAWEVLRRTAPTRPHPRVSRRPPGNLVAAVLLAPLDRIGDHLEALDRRRSIPVAARAVEGLRRLSHRAEQLPPLTWGERDVTSTRGERHATSPPSSPAARHRPRAGRPACTAAERS